MLQLPGENGTDDLGWRAGTRAAAPPGSFQTVAPTGRRGTRKAEAITKQITHRASVRARAAGSQLGAIGFQQAGPSVTVATAPGELTDGLRATAVAASHAALYGAAAAARGRCVPHGFCLASLVWANNAITLRGK